MSAPRAFKKPTIRDVADRAGVSVTTVSHIASGVRSYSPETMRKVNEAIAALRYTPSYIARGLRGRSTNTFGVCAYDPMRISDPDRRRFAEDLWRGVSIAADERDASLLYYSEKIRTGRAVEPFLNGFVDGLIITSDRQDDRPNVIAETGLPVVVQVRSAGLGPGVGASFADETLVVEEALDHLWELGHRRIAHIAGPVHGSADGDGRPDDVASGRYDAYALWMRARGRFREEFVHEVDRWDPEPFRSVLSRLLALPEPPTAVFCANDAIALRLMAEARALDVRVPDDLSVIGVDDSIAASLAEVPLTTIAIPVEEIGRRSVEMLFRLISGAPDEECRVALPPSPVIQRLSCSSPRPSDARLPRILQ